MSFRSVRLLSIHIWRPAPECIRLFFQIHHYHSTRPPHHHPRKKITPLPSKLSLDQEEHKRHVWCYNGVIRRSRNVRIDRNLHALIDRIQIQRWSWTVPRRCGLAVCKATPKEIEKTKKEVCNVFKSKGLKITIDANKKIVHFLGVTFDLTDGSYKPYMKPNNKLSHVHQQSNHPPA